MVTWRSVQCQFKGFLGLRVDGCWLFIHSGCRRRRTQHRVCDWDGGHNNIPFCQSWTQSIRCRLESLHVSADLPESLHVSADLPESLHVSADLPESLHISADLPESLHISADLPESLHISADLPESLHISADLPESLHISADLPESLHISADLPESHNRPAKPESSLVMPAKPEPVLVVPAKPGSARIRRAMPESLSKTATMPADAPLWPGLFASVLDPHWCPEPAPSQELAESAPEPAPSQELAESAPEPAPSQELAESAPEPAPSQELAESAPEPAPSQELAESAPEPAPSQELAESAPEPAPSQELAESAPEPPLVPSGSQSPHWFHPAPQSPMLVPSSSPSSPLVPPSSPLSPLTPSAHLCLRWPCPAHLRLTFLPVLHLPNAPWLSRLQSAPPGEVDFPKNILGGSYPPLLTETPDHGCLKSLPRSLRPYVLSLSLVSQFLLGPSLLPWVAARPGRVLLCRGGPCIVCSSLVSPCLICSGGSVTIRFMILRPLTTRGHPLTTWTLALYSLLHSTSDYNSHHPLHWRHTADCTDHTAT